MKVVIAGELPLVEEVTRLCVDAGHDTNTYLVEDFLSAIQSGFVFEDASDADIAIELHNESAAAKQELLMSLSDCVPYGALIFTSALATSATQAASWVPRPERVVGIGLLPPLDLEGTVELAPALQTSDESMRKSNAFWSGLGYDPVPVADGPGLVRARIVCCLINEAVSTLMEGVASAEDIDQAMKLGTNYPYGPLEWADLIGLDAVLGVLKGLQDEWGDDRYRPSPLLRHMVLAGKLGKKTGQGFFAYDEEG